MSFGGKGSPEEDDDEIPSRSSGKAGPGGPANFQGLGAKSFFGSPKSYGGRQSAQEDDDEIPSRNSGRAGLGGSAGFQGFGAKGFFGSPKSYGGRGDPFGRGGDD
jgi:hypothetical protein